MDTIKLRAAGPADRDRLLEWANDPTTRAASFHAEPIAAASHDAWFAASLDGARTLYIAERAGTPVGTARLDPLGPGRAEVSLTIAPEHRSRGIGTSTLTALIETAVADGVEELVARIRETNAQSRRAFEKAGFTAVGDTSVNGIHAIVYRLRPPVAGERGPIQ